MIYILTGYDKLIIAMVLVMSVLVYVFLSFLTFGDYPERVLITVDGNEYAEYTLSEISGNKNIEIVTEFGKNILEITKNSVRMTDASCPDKTDVLMGEITKVGQMLVCAPNRVVVRIEGKAKISVDKVTY